MSKSCVQIPISESLIVCACKCMFTYVCICLLQCVDRYHTLSEINMPTKASLAGLARLAQARTGGKAVQYVTAEWKPAFLRQAREFLFFPLLPREASKSVSIFDRETGSKPERLRSGFLQADLSLIV